jgi:ArsR family metal-binding transcriptional regulator
MLLHSYRITRVLPCLADPEKIRVIAEIRETIHEVLPYLNATLKGCIYNHAANTLTIRKDQKLISVHPFHITVAKVNDEKEADDVLRWLKDLINQTYEKREQIEPDYSTAAELKALDIYKLLPGTNCKECGEPSCLAFAVKLVGRDTEIKRCELLSEDRYRGKRQVLIDLLQGAGFPVAT